MPANNESNSRQSEAKPAKLGRGLSALMGVQPAPVRVDVPPKATPIPAAVQAVPERASPISSARPITSPTVAPQAKSLSDLQSLRVGDITPNRHQPRREVESSDLATLAASIKVSGVMQPIIVRPILGKPGEATRYELVAGERRWRAAQLAGLANIPAVVRHLSDEQSAEWALVENIQREDLNAMDRALALKALCDTFRLSHAEVGEKLGMDRSSVANLIRLTELESEIGEMIAKGTLGAGHGKALLSAPAGPARVRLAKEASQRSYSVRRVEYEAKRLASGAPAGDAPTGGMPTPREAVLRDIEKRIAQALGTKVAIRTDPTGKRGQITLDFYNLDQFDGLLSRLGVAGS
jgi:ParB family chromosome partitioning protein